MELPSEEKKYRMVFYGRAMAYLARISFGACVVLVFRQRIWRIFRHEALTIDTIDQFFGATEEIHLFYNWEAIPKSPLLVAIALVFYLIPVATVIFSPGALTFGVYPEITVRELPVLKIDFRSETTADWRKLVILPDGSFRRSITYYDSTKGDGMDDDEWFDFYDQPSADVRRIATLLAYNDVYSPNLNEDARQQACGGPYNCTYQQTFVGPGYDCEQVVNGIDQSGNLQQLGASINTTVLAPEGLKVFVADVDQGVYTRATNDSYQSGSVPADLGVFKSEPELWIGVSVNTTERLPPDDPLAEKWTHRYEPQVFRCIHMETNYTVEWNFAEPYYRAKISKKHLARVIDTNYTLGDDGKLDYTKDPEPAQNFVSPRVNVDFYRKIAAYHALGETFELF